MDPKAQALISLSLEALKAVMGLIAEVKSQHNLTDDQLLTHAKDLAAGNDALYTALQATLKAGA